MAILKVPFWVGVPEIIPDEGLKDKPVGRMEAPIERLGVDVLVVVIVYEKAVFIVPEAVGKLLMVGRVHDPPPAGGGGGGAKRLITTESVTFVTPSVQVKVIVIGLPTDG